MARKIMLFLFGFLFIFNTIQAQNVKVNKIVVFSIDCKDGTIGLKSTNKVFTYLKSLEQDKVISFSSFLNYKKASLEEMVKICNESNADAILMGGVEVKYKYGPLTFKGSRRVGILNVKLILKLIDVNTKKILWTNVENSQDYITDQAISVANLFAHIDVVSKKAISNLSENMGFGNKP